MAAGDIINHFADRIKAIHAREEEELRKLCENPDYYDLATKMMDRLLGDLSFLFNFECAINGKGEKVPIQKVYDRLQKLIEVTFETVTGKQYEPTVCRQLDFNRRER